MPLPPILPMLEQEPQNILDQIGQEQAPVFAPAPAPVPTPTPVPTPVESDPVADTAAPLPLPAPVSTLPISLLGSTVGGTFAQPGTVGALPFRTPNFGVNRYIGPELIEGPGVPMPGRGVRRRRWDDLPGRGRR